MHFIRLRGPWRFEVLERLTGDATRPATGKQHLPADWSDILGADFYGTVRYRRTFHEPTGLEEGQQVWLSIAGVMSHATVTLNDTPLAACGPSNEMENSPQENDENLEIWRQEIRHLLLPTSELIIDVSHPTPPSPLPSSKVGGLTGLVQLEIQTVQPRPAD